MAQGSGLPQQRNGEKQCKDCWVADQPTLRVFMYLNHHISFQQNQLKPVTSEICHIKEFLNDIWF